MIPFNTPTSDPAIYEFGSDIWVSHRVLDSSGDPVLDLDFGDIDCIYWQPINAKFIHKLLTANDFINVGNGVYDIRFEGAYIDLGVLLSIITPRNVSKYDFFAYSLSTITAPVSGTCLVTGSFIDFDALPIVRPVEVVVENLYNPIMTNLGGIITRTKTFFSDITGKISFRIIQGMKVRISIGNVGITKAVEIPKSTCANLFELLHNSIDEFEPL